MSAALQRAIVKQQWKYNGRAVGEGRRAGVSGWLTWRFRIVQCSEQPPRINGKQAGDRSEQRTARGHCKSLQIVAD
jgi:hypothetical protein